MTEHEPAAAETLATQAEATAASGETASDPAAFRASMRTAGRSLRETRPTAEPWAEP